jgi:predicted outer membrane repeat protein
MFSGNWLGPEFWKKLVNQAGRECGTWKPAGRNGAASDGEEKMKTKMLLVLLLTGIQLGFTQTSARAKSIQKMFDYLSEKRLFNGAALVVDHGKAVFKRAYGYANMEWQVPNTLDTRFEIGSVTKQFTAALILQLAAEGKIALSDKISRYLPHMAEKFGRKITIHHLLTHTSGLPSHFTSMADYMKIGMRLSYTFQERLQQLQNSEFQFQPGTSWSYNGFGYTILGEIVARVTKKSLEENYKERIFDPLGMKQSGVMLDSRLVWKRAFRYQKKWDDSYIPAVYFAQNKAKLGGGGLYSTVDDLTRWHKALQGRFFLTERMKKSYFTLHYRFPDGGGYCYGHYAAEYQINNNRRVNIYYHGGSLPGASALMLTVPESDQCIVLLHNGGMGHEEFLYTVGIEILNILYGKKFHLPKMSIVYTVGYTALFNSIEQVKKHYLFLKKNRNDAYIFDQDQLNILAMVLKQFGALEKIPAVLKLNIEEYPDRPSAYFHLGTFYGEVDKKYDLALGYLKKALKLSDGEMKKQIKKKIHQVETRMNLETGSPRK